MRGGKGRKERGRGGERRGKTIRIAGDFIFLLILSVFTSILLLSTRYL